jgi:hypothetical protein
MKTSRALAPVVLSLGIACGATLTVAHTARADRYYVVYGPAPAPPPPPGYGGYGYYYYYEPRYALMLGGDVEGVVPIGIPRFNDGQDLTGGGGFKLRIGEQIRLRRWLRITPEIGYGYDHLFAANAVNDVIDDSWDMHRVFGGVRVAFGHVVTPVVYGHLGYGWRVTGDPDVSNEGGVAFDVGGALDFRFIPHLAFGAHIEYVTVDAPNYGPQWLALGVHAELLF